MLLKIDLAFSYGLDLVRAEVLEEMLSFINEI